MPTKLLDEVDVLVEAGVYPSKEELLEEAIRALLRSRPELRQAMAVALYRQGRVSLARAAEIAGLNQEAFKALIQDLNIPYEVPPIGTRAVHEETKRLHYRATDEEK